VGIVNVGFDEPTVRNIIVNCATMSVTKWVQMCGRGGRVLPDKNMFNIIDLGGNSVRFGDWSDDRDWERLFREPERPGKPGLAPVKVCPSCLGLVHAAIRRCPLVNMDGELCDYFFEPEVFVEDTFFSEMKLMTRNIDVKDLIERNKQLNFRPYFTFYELGRICASKIKDKKLTEEEVEFMFNEYFNKVKEWYRIQFPKKKFREEWHRSESRKNFFDNMKQ
jgi:superfamily II DNA or RNA helicase